MLIGCLTHAGKVNDRFKVKISFVRGHQYHGTPQVCTKCREKKPAHNFNRDKTKADGLQFRCKVGKRCLPPLLQTVSAALQLGPARSADLKLHSKGQ